MTTINPINGADSLTFFQSTLEALLKDNSLKSKTESQLSAIIEYVTLNIRQHTLSKDTLEKLITLHSKFLSALCPENFDSSTNQTTPNNPNFVKFSKALHNLEDFYNPIGNKNQTSLKESCASTFNSVTNEPFSLASKLYASFGWGAFTGTSNAVTTIAVESAKSKGYTETQLRLLKAGSVAFNSLAIASYASMASYMENSNESDDAIIEKMWQSFALSLASTTSLYALANGISYFAKSIENKFVKGFLNALPLAGNVCLLVKGGNSLTESAAIIGTNVATAGLFTTAIQSGWNFFSKRHHTEENTDIELELHSVVVENPSSSASIDETPIYINGPISVSNDNTHLYEEIINEENGYLIPNRLNPVNNSAPALPERNPDEYENHRFFVLNQGNGILVSTACRDKTSNLIQTNHRVIS